MHLTPFVVLWACLTIAVLGLALFRYLVSFREDDNIHISEGERGLITDQLTIFHWLDVLDKWGKSLTVVAGVLGLVLAAIYLYSRIPPG